MYFVLWSYHLSRVTPWRLRISLGWLPFIWAILWPCPAATESSASLSFGVFPRWNAQLTVRDFAPLATILARELGRPVRIETDKNFEAFMARVLAGEFDVIHLNQFQYLSAKRHSGYRAVAKVCESRDCTIRALIVTRDASDIKALTDLRGRTIAFGDPGALVSFTVATSMLREVGLAPGDYRSIFTKNPPNALLAVYNGEADAAGVGSSIYDRPEIRRRVDLRQLRVLAQSAPLPGLPVAVRDGLGVQIAERIQKILTDLPSLPGGPEALRTIGADRFDAADDRDYEALQPESADAH
jgi:phosphonate transport system substrate-binding protein